MAIQLQSTEKNLYLIVQAIIQLVNGRGNYVGDVTLTPGATMTSVDFVNCSRDCRVFLQAQTAAAAATASWVALSDTRQGGFTVRHAAAPSGAIYSFSCSGG